MKSIKQNKSIRKSADFRNESVYFRHIVYIGTKNDMEELIMNDNELADITKGIIALCIRNNTSLEDFHSEKLPIDNERMKILMKDLLR